MVLIIVNVVKLFKSLENSKLMKSATLSWQNFQEHSSFAMTLEIIYFKTRVYKNLRWVVLKLQIVPASHNFDWIILNSSCKQYLWQQ